MGPQDGSRFQTSMGRGQGTSDWAAQWPRLSTVASRMRQRESRLGISQRRAVTGRAGLGQPPGTLVATKVGDVTVRRGDAPTARQLVPRHPRPPDGRCRALWRPVWAAGPWRSQGTLPAPHTPCALLRKNGFCIIYSGGIGEEGSDRQTCLLPTRGPAETPSRAFG